MRGTKYSNGEAMVQLFDVTEQQRLEAQMQKGSLALQRVADVVLELELPAWTAEGVRNARLTHATPSFEALFGIPAEAEPGFWTTLCADSSSKDVLHSALLTCERRVEVRFRRRRAVPDKGGSPVIELRTVCVSTVYAPELTGTHTLILICHDLTDFKERIELQKDRELIATLQVMGRHCHHHHPLPPPPTTTSTSPPPPSPPAARGEEHESGAGARRLARRADGR